METATRTAGGLTRAMRAALTEAMEMRRSGAPREIGMLHLLRASFNEALAEMIMDHCDAVNAFARTAAERKPREERIPHDRQQPQHQPPQQQPQQVPQSREPQTSHAQPPSQEQPHAVPVDPVAAFVARRRSRRSRR